MKVTDIFENDEKQEVDANKTAVQLEHELAALRKAGPHPVGSAGHTKMRLLTIALRRAKGIEKGKK